LHVDMLTAGIIMFLFWYTIVPYSVIDIGGKKKQ